MCSIITHQAIPIAVSFFLPRASVSPKLILIGVICSIIPDLDVVGFHFGVRYGDMLGHRGFSHSIIFAGSGAALLTITLFRGGEVGRWVIFLFFFASTLSHGLVDMLTNGGLGVALLAPFDNGRYFFPYRPIEVSPLGIANFFSRRGLEVMTSELKWVWFPSVIVSPIGYLIRRSGNYQPF
jgi:inner membrane protein